MDITKLSPIKLKLLEDCYRAILLADENKIKQAQEDHFKTDDWLEEDCTPSLPTLHIHCSGIGNTLTINNTCCLDEDIDW
jgi:hypothetical protein